MVLRSVVSGFILAMCAVSFSTFADTTKECNDQQKTNCSSFCEQHNQMKSCIIDIDKLSGTCTCGDGTSHTKSK